MTLDPAPASDPEGLAALHDAAMPGGRAWRAEEFATLCAAPGALLHAVPGEGFALGRVAADEAELLMLAVLPDRRRRGLGLRLLTGFETSAATRGAEVALLEVAVTNTPAVALYGKAGYVARGRRRGYYRSAEGDRVDALILGKRLFRET